MAVSPILPALLCGCPIVICGLWRWTRERSLLPFLLGAITGWGGMAAGAVGLGALGLLHEALDPGGGPRYFTRLAGPALGCGEWIVTAAVVVLTGLRRADWDRSMAFALGLASGLVLLPSAPLWAAVFDRDSFLNEPVSMSIRDLAPIAGTFPCQVLAVAWTCKAAREERLPWLFGSFLLFVFDGTMQTTLPERMSSCLGPLLGIAAVATLIVHDRRARCRPPNSPSRDTIAA